MHFANGLDRAPAWRGLSHPALERIRQAFPDPWQNYQRTIMSLIETGFFDRWPDARLVQAEQGIAFPEEFSRTAQLAGLRDPAPYLKHNFWYTIELEERQFMSQAAWVGWSQLLFATDWPHGGDAGGANRYEDTNYVNRMLAKNYITQEQYDRWLTNITNDKLIVLQSNDYNIYEHVRISESLIEFKRQSKLTKIFYEGELDLPRYKRFMIIGKASNE